MKETRSVKKLPIIICIVIYSTLDFPTVVGIVTFMPFLAFSIWIAWKFIPKEDSLRLHIALKNLRNRFGRRMNVAVSAPHASAVCRERTGR